MPRDVNGNHALPEAPFVIDTEADPAKVNNVLSDLGAEITDSLSRRGKGGMLADLPMGGKRVTDMAPGVAATDGVRMDQLAPYLPRDNLGNVPVGSTENPGILYNVEPGTADSHAATVGQINAAIATRVARDGNGNVRVGPPGVSTILYGLAAAYAGDQAVNLQQLNDRLAPVLARDGSGNTNVSGVLYAVAPAYASDQAVRMDQVWARLASQSVTNGGGDINFVLPPGYRRFRVEIEDMTPGGLGALFLRFSVNAGVSWAQGAGDYSWVGNTTTAGAVAAAGQNETLIRLSPNTNQRVYGEVEWGGDYTPTYLHARTSGTSGGVHFTSDTSGRCNLSAIPTHVLLGFVNQASSRAFVTLYGARR